MRIFGEILSFTMLSMGLGVIAWLTFTKAYEVDEQEVADESWASIMEVVGDA